MAITGIYTNLNDTALGTESVDDSISMLIVPAKAESASGGASFDLNTPYMVASMQDVTNIGVTAANNATLIFHAQQFFDKAGSGQRLWVVGYTAEVSAWTSLAANLPNLVQRTVVGSFDYRPRMIGIVGDPIMVTARTVTDPLIPAVVTSAIPKFESALESMFTDGFRTCAVVDAILLNCTGVGGVITEQLTTRLTPASDLDAPRIALQVTTSEPAHTASIGQTLGMLASVTLSTSIGAVAVVGPVSNFGYFIDSNLTNWVNTPVAAVPKSRIDIFGQNQYLFTRSRQEASQGGVYYNDDATCNVKTMALSSLKNVRVGNAICDSVARFFTDLLNTNLPTDASGNISAAYRDSTLADLRSRYLLPRINRGEAQEIQVNFWAKDGNFISSQAIEVEVRILPYQSLREVYIETSFVISL